MTQDANNEIIVDQAAPKLSKEFAESLIKAMAQIEGAVKDSNNPHFNHKYADLSAVIEAVKKPLCDNGLTYFQRPLVSRGVKIETVLIHSSGETLSCGAVEVPIDKPTAQGYGSAITYARRYSLSMALGVPQLDDDGHEASNPKRPPQKQQSPQAPAPASKPQQPATIYMYDFQGETLADEQINFLKVSQCIFSDELGVWCCAKNLGPKLEKYHVLKAKKQEIQNQADIDGDDLPESMGGAPDEDLPGFEKEDKTDELKRIQERVRNSKKAA